VSVRRLRETTDSLMILRFLYSPQSGLACEACSRAGQGTRTLEDLSTIKKLGVDKILLEVSLWVELDPLHVDVLHDIPVQGEGGLSDLKDMGRVLLVHPDDASGNDPEGAETIEPLV